MKVNYNGIIRNMTEEEQKEYEEAQALAEMQGIHNTPSVEDRVADLERERALVDRQTAALSAQNDFHEELIVELANVVYA